MWLCWKKLWISNRLCFCFVSFLFVSFFFWGLGTSGLVGVGDLLWVTFNFAIKVKISTSLPYFLYMYLYYLHKSCILNFKQSYNLVSITIFYQFNCAIMVYGLCILIRLNLVWVIWRQEMIDLWWLIFGNLTVLNTCKIEKIRWECRFFVNSPTIKSV